MAFDVKALQSKAIEWLIPVLGVTLLGWLAIAREYIESIIQTQPKWVLRLLILLLTISVVLGSWLVRLRPNFVEYKGSFFKRKSGGGYHDAVYCGICKSPLFTDSYHVASIFKCKCGWVSEITKGSLPYDIKGLNKEP